MIIILLNNNRFDRNKNIQTTTEQTSQISTNKSHKSFSYLIVKEPFKFGKSHEILLRWYIVKIDIVLSLCFFCQCVSSNRDVFSVSCTEPKYEN